MKTFRIEGLRRDVPHQVVPDAGHWVHLDESGRCRRCGRDVSWKDRGRGTTTEIGDGFTDLAITGFRLNGSAHYATSAVEPVNSEVSQLAVLVGASANFDPGAPRQ